MGQSNSVEEKGTKEQTGGKNDPNGLDSAGAISDITDMRSGEYTNYAELPCTTMYYVH